MEKINRRTLVMFRMRKVTSIMAVQTYSKMNAESRIDNINKTWGAVKRCR